MSKFFAEGNISSDSSDSQESVDKKAQNKKNVYQYDQSHIYHEEKRVILNEKEKKNKIFKDLGNKTLAALKIMDYDIVWSSLQDLRKQIAKAEKFIEKNGIPRIFLRVLNQVNEQVQQTTGEQKKKLKNAKGFNILKQKLKKEIMPLYEKDIEKIKDLESEQEESESSEEKISSSSESEEEDIMKKYLKSDDPMQRRKYWLKRPKQEKEKEKEKQKEKDKEKQKDSDNEKEKNRKKSEVVGKKKSNYVQVKKKETKIVDVKEAQALLRKLLSEFATLKDQEKREQYLEHLDVIIKESQNYKAFKKLSILLVDIPIRIQVTKQMNLTHFPRENWIKIFKNIEAIYSLITESGEEDLISNIVHFDDSSSGTVSMTEEYIYRLLKTFILNLERQIKKAFTFLESGESQYSERLQDLLSFIDFMYKIAGQMSEDENLETERADICFKVVENMYFMSNNFLEKINSGNKFSFATIKLQDYVAEILKILKKEEMTKILLYMAYNHAINRRDKGKDLLVISNVLQIINTCDYYTQACFNRALAQLGINAFCQGSLHETQQFLSQLCGYGKSKEQNKQIMKQLLAQQQISEKQSIRSKPLPYYLHLNLNVLEAIQLISSMTIEIPYTLSEGGRITSKTLKRLFNEYEKAHFIAEPLNYRDLIYAASNDLKLGNWRECFDRIMQADIWSEFDDMETVKRNVLLAIKESALHCYLIGNQKCFKCLSLDGLSRKFQLQLPIIKRFIFKWIHKQLHATITDDGYLNMIHKREQKETSIKQSCEKLFMKLQQINKTNEQMLSQQIGSIPQEDYETEKDQKSKRRINPAMTQRLKSILNRRG